MKKVDKIQEFIDRYKEGLKENYKMLNVFEGRRKKLGIKTPDYPEGLNDGIIQMKEYFIEELKELEECCRYE